MAPPPTGGPQGTRPRETGKLRAQRIPLDYFRKSDAITRTKLWLTGAALVAALVWWLSGWVPGVQANLRYSHGPVAGVHQAWEAQCEACHVNFPVGVSALMTPITGKIYATKNDAQCQQCHMGHASQAHHKNEKPESVPNCGRCHRDHRGREVSLVRVGDSDCTNCHRNLQAHTEGATSPFENKVTAFATDHPDFRSRKADPGKIKFNHFQHMLPGQMPDGTAAENQWTLGRIKALDPAAYERYKNQPWQKGKGDNDAVVLDCASCHQLDSREFGVKDNFIGDVPSAAVLPSRAAGAYMLPITYENQCKACHPIDVKDMKAPVPHRVQPDELRHFVQGVYTREYLIKQENPLLDVEVKAGVPIPGKEPGGAAAMARDAIKAQVDRAMTALLTGKKTCGECHVDAEGKDLTYRPEEPGAPEQPLPKIAPSSIPDVWFEHAKFNHMSHRAVSCRDCHEKAYAFKADGTTRNDPASVTHTDVLIPDITNCRQCHAPASGGKGGVRHDCAECHTYHHGDAPRAGLGARAREPVETHSIDKWLSGKLK